MLNAHPGFTSRSGRGPKAPRRLGCTSDAAWGGRAVGFHLPKWPGRCPWYGVIRDRSHRPRPVCAAVAMTESSILDAIQPQNVAALNARCDCSCPIRINLTCEAYPTIFSGNARGPIRASRRYSQTGRIGACPSPRWVGDLCAMLVPVYRVGDGSTSQISVVTRHDHAVGAYIAKMGLRDARIWRVGIITEPSQVRAREGRLISAGLANRIAARQASAALCEIALVS